MYLIKMLRVLTCSECLFHTLHHPLVGHPSPQNQKFLFVFSEQNQFITFNKLKSSNTHTLLKISLDDAVSVSDRISGRGEWAAEADRVTD